MAVDAIEGYLASLLNHGEPIPSDEEGLTATVTVEHAPEPSRA
jgi:predicted RNase H-like HicB family nuclease